MAMKAYLRGRISSFASFKKKTGNENITTLESEPKTLGHKDRAMLNKTSTAKQKLDTLCNKKAGCALLRTNQPSFKCHVSLETFSSTIKALITLLLC